MRFTIAGEGLTDFIVLKNLLIGFFNNKNLPVNRLLPKDKEPIGWGNVLKYLSTEEFRNGVINSDYCIVQIDTNECECWNQGLKHIGDDESKVNEFIIDIIKVLIKRIGQEYNNLKNKIIFAISVHQMECWLLPFNSTLPAQVKKIVTCENAIEKIASKKGFSIHQKFYKEGENYNELSKEMKNHKVLLKKSQLNPSLKIFIDTLKAKTDNIS